MDRAVVEIDEALSPAYEVRRAHAEVRLTKIFHSVRLLIHNSTEWVNHSGTRRPLGLISPRHCPKP